MKKLIKLSDEKKRKKRRKKKKGKEVTLEVHNGTIGGETKFK